MNATIKQDSPAFAMNEQELLGVLESSLYPGASKESIKLVIGYCKASGLDPMQKPVHIVPMWDSKASRMRDVIMPGVGSYRTQAARSGQYAGVTEPEFGPDVTENIGGVEITYPVWCRVTVKRRLPSGEIVEFSAVERWKENYAVKGGKEKSIAPNAMWAKRPYGQISKCAEAQALRKAFPEVGAQPTADEMEGKSLAEDNVIEGQFRKEPEKPEMPALTPDLLEKQKPRILQALTAGTSTADGIIAKLQTKYVVDNSIQDVIRAMAVPEPTQTNDEWLANYENGAPQ